MSPPVLVRRQAGWYSDRVTLLTLFLETQPLTRAQVWLWLVPLRKTKSGQALGSASGLSTKPGGLAYIPGLLGVRGGATGAASPVSR